MAAMRGGSPLLSLCVVLAAAARAEGLRLEGWGRRDLFHRSAAATAAALLAPCPALAARKGMMADKKGPEESICYGPNYERVPCASASEVVGESAQTALAKPSADTPDRLDVNNVVAVDFTVFPGLYPTIGPRH
eukprot:scaffold218233_cov41-Tisochrysis_lutea.AAC.2